jgi:hypothetical protein
MSFDRAAYEARKARDTERRGANQVSDARWKSAWAEWHRSGKTGPKPPRRYKRLIDRDAGVEYLHVEVTDEGRVVNVLRAERNDWTADPVDVDLVVVQALVDKSRAKWREYRSESAQRAAVTRRKRHDLEVYALVERLKAGGKLSPSQHCVLCRRGLTDDESIARGIGPECWGEIMERLTAARELEVRS